VFLCITVQWFGHTIGPLLEYQLTLSYTMP